ncbi:MAG: phosphohydrolase [Bacteroidetes bacterium RIFCSPHIGHO2_02_FULL_44_7]|nr:MAG: phosphohydrolase [Bacteroidetes bacterium RIFCSPHIGHO2_02_FULL_44_7]
MNQEEIIQKTQEFVQQKFSGEGTGHDWYHINRVRKLALEIAQAERADLFIVELGALLHDIADHKFHGGDLAVGPKKAQEWLESVGADQETIEKVCHIVANVSFKGAGSKNAMESLEGKVVQDADRLDASGAIGIARAFTYGGTKGRLIYQPGVEPGYHKNFQEHQKEAASTLNHFYEKLLHIKNLMNTATGLTLAEERHRYVEDFLSRFLAEWEGEN